MARLTPLWTAPALREPAEISAFLDARGIRFERWTLPEEVTELASRRRLDDDAKARLLELFRVELAREADAAGYVDADVIAIRPDLPGLDGALAKFDKVHFHDDDEVRAIVGGRGVFGFIADDGRQFLLQIEAGEFISVPAGAWHWFYCLEDRDITALRLFKDSAGWTPRYRSTARGVPGSEGDVIR